MNAKRPQLPRHNAPTQPRHGGFDPLAARWRPNASERDLRPGSLTQGRLKAEVTMSNHTDKPSSTREDVNRLRDKAEDRKSGSNKPQAGTPKTNTDAGKTTK
jgi:hypothetical protein